LDEERVEGEEARRGVDISQEVELGMKPIWIRNKKMTLRELIELYRPRWMETCQSEILTMEEWGEIPEEDLDTAPETYAVERRRGGILLRVDL